MSYLAYPSSKNSVRTHFLLAIVITMPIAVWLYTDAPSCGQGTILEGNQCIPEGWQGVWTEVIMDLNYDDSKITVEEGTHVRMIFNSSKDSDHFIPKTFTLPEFGISTNIPVEEEYVIDFFAEKVGEFPYSSTGLCKVEIAGGNTVIVDCSIFCGEIGNARTGTIIVEPVILNDLDESNRSK